MDVLRKDIGHIVFFALLLCFLGWKFVLLFPSLTSGKIIEIDGAGILYIISVVNVMLSVSLLSIGVLVHEVHAFAKKTGHLPWHQNGVLRGFMCVLMMSIFLFIYANWKEKSRVLMVPRQTYADEVIQATLQKTPLVSPVASAKEEFEGLLRLHTVEYVPAANQEETIAFRGMHFSVEGVKRLDAAMKAVEHVCALNLANIQATSDPGGKNMVPYIRKRVSVQNGKFFIENDISKMFTATYDPGHPDASEEGIVINPNVSAQEEVRLRDLAKDARAQLRKILDAKSK